MEKRILGKTGQKLSVVGFGGMILKDEDHKNSKKLIDEAIQRGINYFDVAPFYGNAEERMGPALKPYRSSVFLACKTLQRTKVGAEKELYQSLEHLCTDYLDLYQLHMVTTLYEVDQIMGYGGAIEAFVEARKKGLVRYLGFSAHSEIAALALLDRFDFDSILFPINWVCWYQGDFGPKVLRKALNKEMGILALKALAKRKLKEGEKTKWPKCWYLPVESPEEASLALRFTLTKPVTSAVSPGHSELLWWACDAADNYKPLSDSEAKKLKEISESLEPILWKGIIV